MPRARRQNGIKTSTFYDKPQHNAGEPPIIRPSSSQKDSLPVKSETEPLPINPINTEEASPKKAQHTLPLTNIAEIESLKPIAASTDTTTSPSEIKISSKTISDPEDPPLSRTPSTPDFLKANAGNGFVTQDLPNDIDKKHNGSATKSKFQKISDFFKGTDGWDELGSALGQTLPGIGQHIATLSFLSVLTPAVYLGMKGMATEYDEAHAAINAAKKAKQQLLAQIEDVFDIKIDADTFEKGTKSVQKLIKKLKAKKKQGPENFIKKQELLAEYSDAIYKENADKVAYDAAPLGVAAMSGMFAGMLSATATSALEIAHETTKMVALETAAKAGEIATASLFVPAQAAMVGYSLMKQYQGRIENKFYKEAKKALAETKEHAGISDDFYDACQDNLDRHIDYTHREKIIYGRGLAVSEMGMMTGTILGSSGVAAPISLPVLIPSAAATIGFAGLRIHTMQKKGQYTGNPHDHIHDGNAKKALKDTGKHLYRRTKNLLRRGNNSEDIPTTDKPPCPSAKVPLKKGKNLNGLFNNATDNLVKQKLVSLAITALDHKDPKASFQKMLKTAKKDKWHGTTLQKDVIAQMKTAYEQNPQIYDDLLEDKTSLKNFIEEHYLNGQTLNDYLQNHVKDKNDKPIYTNPQARLVFKNAVKKFVSKKEFLNADIDDRLLDVGLANKNVLNKLAFIFVRDSKQASKKERQGAMNGQAFVARYKKMEQDAVQHKKDNIEFASKFKEMVEDEKEFMLPINGVQENNPFTEGTNKVSPPSLDEPTYPLYEGKPQRHIFIPTRNTQALEETEEKELLLPIQPTIRPIKNCHADASQSIS